MATILAYQIHSNSLLLGSSYDDLRLRMEGCGGAEKFWSFGPKLPNRPPYGGAPRLEKWGWVSRATENFFYSTQTSRQKHFALEPSALISSTCHTKYWSAVRATRPLKSKSS